MRRNSDFPEPVVPPTSTCGPSRHRSIEWSPSARSRRPRPAPRARHRAPRHPPTRRPAPRSDAGRPEHLGEADRGRQHAPEPATGSAQRSGAKARESRSVHHSPTRSGTTGTGAHRAVEHVDDRRRCRGPSAATGKASRVPWPRTTTRPARGTRRDTTSPGGPVPRGRHDEHAVRRDDDRAAARDGIRDGPERRRRAAAIADHDHTAGARRRPRRAASAGARRTAGPTEPRQQAVGDLGRPHDAEAARPRRGRRRPAPRQRAGGVACAALDPGDARGHLTEAQPHARRSSPPHRPGIRRSAVDEHRGRVGVGPVAAAPLVGQRQRRGCSRAARTAARVGSERRGGAARPAPQRSPSARASSTTGPSSAKSEQLRPEEQGQCDGHRDRHQGREPRHAGPVPLGRRCGAGDLDDLAPVHRAAGRGGRRARVPSPRRSDRRGPAPAAAAAAGSTSP